MTISANAFGVEVHSASFASHGSTMRKVGTSSAAGKNSRHSANVFDGVSVVST